MVSVTGMTVAEINHQLDEMVVGVEVVGGHIIYSKRSGEEIDAGELVDADLAVNAAYPVGALFMATVPTSPADLLGIGTWIRFGKGRTLVSLDETQTEFDTVEETGGEKTVTLTVAQLPAHNHLVGPHYHDIPSHYHQIAVSYRSNLYDSAGSRQALTRVGGAGAGDVSGSSTGDSSSNIGGSWTEDSAAFNTGNKGDGTPHNNLPPYIVVYIWKRTA